MGTKQPTLVESVPMITILSALGKELHFSWTEVWNIG